MENFFSKNIKYIRELKGLSQNKLAEMLDVNQTTIARWEDENRIPTIDKAIQVSSILKIPLNILIGKDLRVEKIELSELPSDNIIENDIITLTQYYFKFKELIKKFDNYSHQITELNIQLLKETISENEFKELEKKLKQEYLQIKNQIEKLQKEFNKYKANTDK